MSIVRAELRTRKRNDRVCIVCDEQFAGRSGSRYCSTRCRTTAHRLRADTRASEPETSAPIGLGYEGKSVDDFIKMLNDAKVTTLVDVRLNAISRKRGFSKTALRTVLEANGIGYTHFRALGNPKNNRVGYGEIDTPGALAARESFRDSLQSELAQDALSKILHLSKSEKIALFCFEHESANCHREQIIEALQRLRIDLD